MENKNNKRNPWKIIAIVFIILFILASAFIIYAYFNGTEIMNNRLKCSNDICYGDNADSFTYDEITKTCSCYLQGNLNHEEVLS